MADAPIEGVCETRRIREDSRPLYIRVASALRDDIISGRLSSEAKLPSEAELTRMFGVSRATVREALSALERDGLISKAQGKGTFARRPQFTLSSGLSRNKGFTETVREMGLTPGTSYLSLDWEPADSNLARVLRVPLGTSITVIKRVRTADGEPMIYTVDRLPTSILGEDITKETFPESLFEHLRDKRGIVFGYSDLSVQSIVPSPYVAGLLHLPPNMPLLLIEEVYYTPRDEPILTCQNYYRSDRYKFRIRV
ncbi:MAG: GntR family transcriptional regulator [Bacillota bacterium]